jgi:uncharacterized membrane protein YdfJ with MMPL/SSD domain
MRRLFSESRDWEKALAVFFAEPARAIVRNLLIVAIGFLPLLLAPLVPYNTVGNLIASILFVSGCVTLVLIPAVFRVTAPYLFTTGDRRRTTVFGTHETVLAGVITAALVFVVFHPIYPINGPMMPAYLLLAFLIVYKIWLSKPREAT